MMISVIICFCFERSRKVWRVNKKTQLPVLWIEDQQSQQGEELNDVSITCIPGNEYLGSFSHHNSVPQKIFLRAIHLLVTSSFPFFLQFNFHFHLMKVLLLFILLTISSFLFLISNFHLTKSCCRLFIQCHLLYFVFPILCLAFNLLKGGQSSQTTRAHHNRNFLQLLSYTDVNIGYLTKNYPFPQLTYHCIDVDTLKLGE